MLAHATERPPSFASLELDTEIPQSVEQVVFAALEKDPNDRPQSARDLYEAYETALSIDEMGIPTQHTAEDDLSGMPPIVVDPTTLSFQLEAWMPESIALMKLRGYAHDMGGEVLESVPGMIRIRLGGNAGNRVRKSPLMSLSWFGIGRRTGPITLELHLHQMDAQKGNRLFLQVVFRPNSVSQLERPGLA